MFAQFFAAGGTYSYRGRAASWLLAVAQPLLMRVVDGMARAEASSPIALSKFIVHFG
jgi:hypothetical protein